jgi:hypothetical protein
MNDELLRRTRRASHSNFIHMEMMPTNSSSNYNMTSPAATASCSVNIEGSQEEAAAAAANSDIAGGGINPVTGLTKSNSEPTFKDLLGNDDQEGAYIPSNSQRNHQPHRINHFLHEHSLPPGGGHELHHHHHNHTHQSSLPPHVYLVRAKSSNYRSLDQQANGHNTDQPPAAFITISTSRTTDPNHEYNNHSHSNYHPGHLDDQFVEEVVSNLRKMNQHSSLSSQEDRLDPKLIPKVIKKSLIDLHKRSMWNLAHQQAHQLHLQKIHEQQQQQQAQSKLLFGQKKSLGNNRQNSIHHTSKEAAENAIASSGTNNTKQCLTTSNAESSLNNKVNLGVAARSGPIVKASSNPPTGAANSANSSYQMSANVITQAKPRNEIKMKVVDNSYV